MYSLDVNFLNDRQDRTVEVRSTRRSSAAVPVGDRRPLLFGLAAGLAAVALVAGYWLVLRNQVKELQARSAELDQEIAQVQSQLQELSGIQAQIAAVEAEIQAFVSIFDQILPWSALLQDLRNNTPARVQIETLSQTAGETLSNQGAVEPPVAGGIELVGKACSFDDVNDFLLLLQRSPLLDGNSVRLVSSQRPEEPIPEEEGNCPGTPPGAPEFLVDYT
ncbi:pilus assembly protein PilN, partial [filamentous cyanobacterium CCP5]